MIMATRARRAVSRPSWPFSRSEHAFDGCALRIGAEPFDSGKSTFIIDESEGFGIRDLEFEVKLALDPARMTEETGIRPKDIQVAVILYNDGAKLHDQLARWPSESVPRTLNGSLKVGTYGPHEVELALVAFLGRGLEYRQGRAWRLGSSLAERQFRICVPTAASLLRVNWTSFAEKGWPSAALWHLQIRSVEGLLDALPEEVIEIHLNKDLPVLVELFSAAATRNANLSPTAAVLRPLVAAEILYDIVLAVLRGLAEHDEISVDDLEQDRLAARVLALLREQANLEAMEAIRRAKEEPESLKGSIHAIVDVGRYYDHRLLERLLRR